MAIVNDAADSAHPLFQNTAYGALREYRTGASSTALRLIRAQS